MRPYDQLVAECKVARENGLPAPVLTPDEKARAFGDPKPYAEKCKEAEDYIINRFKSGGTMSRLDKKQARQLIRERNQA